MTDDELNNIDWSKIDTSNSINIFEYFDSAVMQSLKINDNEYDFICEHATDEELNLIVSEKLTFAQKRQLVTTVKKYKQQYADYSRRFDF